MSRYTLIDPEGREATIAIDESMFDAPIVLPSGELEPTSYQALGYTLGFSDDSMRRPHSEDSVRVASEGILAMEARALAMGVAPYIGPVPADTVQTEEIREQTARFASLGTEGGMEALNARLEAEDGESEIVSSGRY